MTRVRESFVLMLSSFTNLSPIRKSSACRSTNSLVVSSFTDVFDLWHSLPLIEGRRIAVDHILTQCGFGKSIELVHADFAPKQQYRYPLSYHEVFFQVMGNVDDSQAAILNRLNDIEQV